MQGVATNLNWIWSPTEVCPHLCIPTKIPTYLFPLLFYCSIIFCCVERALFLGVNSHFLPYTQSPTCTQVLFFLHLTKIPWPNSVTIPTLRLNLHYFLRILPPRHYFVALLARPLPKTYIWLVLSVTPTNTSLDAQQVKPSTMHNCLVTPLPSPLLHIQPPPHPRYVAPTVLENSWIIVEH